MSSDMDMDAAAAVLEDMAHGNDYGIFQYPYRQRTSGRVSAGNEVAATLTVDGLVLRGSGKTFADAIADLQKKTVCRRAGSGLCPECGSEMVLRCSNPAKHNGGVA